MRAHWRLLPKPILREHGCPADPRAWRASCRVGSYPQRPAEADVQDEHVQVDRRALDEVVFDVLGLTTGERVAVYEAVVELILARFW